MRLIQTARPNPCLVTLAILAFSWLTSGLSQRIGGQPLIINLEAAAAMDYANVYTFDWNNVAPIPTTILLALEVLSILLSIGYNRYCLNVCREEAASFSDLLAGFEFPLRAILLWILTHLIVALLSILLVIPGLIAFYSYIMAPRLLCDHPDWSVMRCLRESRRLMHGHKWEMFVLHLSFLGWILLTIIPIASVFVEPYIGLTETTYYLKLVGGGTDPDLSGGGEEKPPWEY